MTNSVDVLIVGGGVAGLTAAAYCAKTGWHTLLLERAAHTGGLVGSFAREGFTFDAGIRALEDSGVIAPMLRSLGIDLPLVRNPVSVGITDRWVRLENRASLTDYADLYKSFFPDNAGEIDAIIAAVEKVMGYMDVLYGIENPLFLESELKDPQYLMKTLLPWLLKYSVNMKKADRLDEPVRTYLKKFTTSEELIDMICQHFFAETPTFFALSYFGLYLDYRYPLGGTGTLPAKLEAAIREKGGEVVTGTAVVEIDSSARTARLADGQTVSYRTLIWAADQRSLYRALKQPLPKQAQRQQDLAEHSHGIDSILTLYLATNLPPEQVQSVCGAHGFYTPITTGLGKLPVWQSLRCEGSEAIRDWVVSYLETTTYEISVPVLRDASLAPEGQSGLVISTLFDYSLTKWFADAGEYDAFKQLASDTMLRVLGNTIFPGLRDSVRFSLCSTPMTIERETGNLEGAITGWANTNRPVPAVHRFGAIKHSVETPVPNVLQCGMWTFSPAGLPVSIITGKLAADAANAALKPAKGRRMIGFWIELAIILLGFAAAALLFYKMPRLPVTRKTQVSLRVSVVIPARNEAKTLPLLLGDLVKQTVFPLEILVADDASEDDTADIARSFDAIVLNLPEKPADWVGKSWACQMGAKAASGDVFLFLDADVRLAPDALDRILAAYEAGGTVSVQPYHATQRAYEQFSFFFNLIQIGAIGAALPKPKQFGLFGPVVAISRADYFAAGGHESVKGSVLEDMALAGQLQRSGVPFRLFVGESDVSFRMYPAGFRSLLQGFSKNLATGAVKTPIWLILLVTLFFASLASVPLHLALALLRGEAIALLYASLYPVWVLALVLLGRRIGRFWPVSVLLYPLPLAFYLLIFLYSGLLRLFRCKVKWKGRAVPLER